MNSRQNAGRRLPRNHHLIIRCEGSETLNKMQASTESACCRQFELEEMAFLHGQSYDSYLSTEGDLRQFWSSDHQAVLAYARLGKYVHIQGGLLGAVENRQKLLTEFRQFIERKRLVATFYNIGETDLPFFKTAGFQITKWGEEPVLDVQDVTWTGKEFEWVRRQANYCRRQNIVVHECCREDYSEDDWNQLLAQIQAIATDCLSTKPQRGEVRFFNGQVNPPNWDRRRLFVARSDNGAGRIEGFLICLPYDGANQWAIDTYRHRLDSPRGVVPFLIHQAVEHLKCDGVQSVSLCLCPAVRYEKLPRDSWIIRRCLQFGFNYASAFFDMPGEYHFKSRFRPSFIRRFICHWPNASIGSMCSTIRLSAAIDLDWGNLFRNAWKRFNRPQVRRNLVSPNESGSPVTTQSPSNLRSEDQVTVNS